MFGWPNGEARAALEFPLDKLAQIILLARAYDAQVSEADIDEAGNANDDRLVSALNVQADNPIEQDMQGTRESLSNDEQAALVALT